jgi:hypothetical protein
MTRDGYQIVSLGRLFFWAKNLFGRARPSLFPRFLSLMPAKLLS